MQVRSSKVSATMFVLGLDGFLAACTCICVYFILQGCIVMVLCCRQELFLCEDFGLLRGPRTLCFLRWFYFQVWYWDGNPMRSWLKPCTTLCSLNQKPDVSVLRDEEITSVSLVEIHSSPYEDTTSVTDLDLLRLRQTYTSDSTAVTTFAFPTWKWSKENTSWFVCFSCTPLPMSLLCCCLAAGGSAAGNTSPLPPWCLM